MLIASKFTLASSSDCPPDKNVIPGTAAGTVRCRAVTVAMAISAGLFFTVADCPEVTIFGLRRVPSRYTL